MLTIREAITILTEFNKWRRGEHPYDGETPETYRGCPYLPKEIGEAIDVAIERMNNEVEKSIIK